MRARLMLCVIAIALAPTLALADDYDEFRVPDHAATDWSVVVDGWADRWASSNSTDGRRTSSGNARVGTTFSYWFDGEHRSSELFASVQPSASVRSANERSEYDFLTGHELRLRRSWERGLTQDWTLSAGRKHWLGLRSLAWTADLQASGFYQQSNTHAEYSSSTSGLSGTQLQRDDFRRRTSQTLHEIRGSVGVGIGRVRDVTGVHVAHVLEARLRESGALVRDLTPHARQRLAALATSAPVLGRTEDQPGTVLWRAIEDVLRDDDALSERGLTAASAFRAGEAFLGRDLVVWNGLPLMPTSRTRGQWIGFVVGGEHHRDLTRGDERFHRATYLADSLTSEILSESSHRISGHSDVATAGFDAEWYRPSGDRWQWSAVAEYRASLRSHSPLHRIRETIRADWLVLDRWVVTASADHVRFIVDVAEQTPVGNSFWSVGLTGRVSWYLRNQLALTLMATDSQFRERSWADASPGWGSRRYRRIGDLSLRLTYRLRSGVRAPGFPALEAAGARTPSL